MLICTGWFKKPSKNMKNFIRNGGILLEKLVASCDGKYNPIRTFSVKDLEKATNCWDDKRIVNGTGDFTLYQGVMEDRTVYIKNYFVFRNVLWGSPYTNIVIGSQMSSHKNVLKLIGCCLESPLPMVVYEFAGAKTLADHVSGAMEMEDSQLPSFKDRIKAALGIANAVAYLHTALPRPVIYRDINPSKVILDENYEAKLFDFSLCRSIPDGESHVEVDLVIGTQFYSAPEYVGRRYLTEKSDVYSYGRLLLVILFWQLFFCESSILYDDEAMINEALKKVEPALIHQRIEAAKLVIKCTETEAEGRPTMVEVAKELLQIYRSLP